MIVRCSNVESVGRFAMFEYAIISTIPKHTAIKIEVDGKTVVFSQKIFDVSDDIYSFVDTIGFCEKLKDCFYLKDFDIAVSYGSDNCRVLLTAKHRGLHSFSMSAVNGDNNTVSLISSYAGMDVATLPGYTVMAWWESERSETPQAFFYPDKNGMVYIDSEVASSLISEYHTPPVALGMVPKQMFVLFKYRINIAEYYGSPAVINRVVQSDWMYALDGYLSDNSADSDTPDWLDILNLPVNNSHGVVRIIGRDTGMEVYANRSKPEYVYLLVVDTALADDATVNCYIKCDNVDSDGVVSTSSSKFDLKNNSIYAININADNKGVAYRKMSIGTTRECFNTTVVMTPDYENQYLFLFKNRYGIASCIASHGIKVEKQADIEKHHYSGMIRTSASNVREHFTAMFTLNKRTAEEFYRYDFGNAYMAINGRWEKLQVYTDTIEGLDSDNDISEVSLQFSFCDIIDKKVLPQGNWIYRNTFVEPEIIKIKNEQ